MNELVVADEAPEWPRLKALVLDSMSSPITRLVYDRPQVEPPKLAAGRSLRDSIEYVHPELRLRPRTSQCFRFDSSHF